MKDNQISKSIDQFVIPSIPIASIGTVDVKSLLGLNWNFADALAPLMQNAVNVDQILNATRGLMSPVVAGLDQIGQIAINNMARINAELVSQVGMTLGKMNSEFEKFIQGIIAPQVSAMHAWVGKLSPLMAQLGAIWESLSDKYDVSEKVAISTLRKYNWFVAPSMPIHFVYEVVKLGRKRGNKRKEMNRLFVDYFLADNHRGLNECIESWRSDGLANGRHKILRDCSYLLQLRGRRFNPCSFVLPVLISQIDGIRHSLLTKSGLSPSGLRWEDTNGQSVNWKKHLRNAVVVDQMDDLASDLLLAVLFQTAYHGVALKRASSFNRHKIMHGESLYHGRIDNVIRAVMLIDFLLVAGS